MRACEVFNDDQVTSLFDGVPRYYSLLRRKAAQKSQPYGLKIQKAKTIKANTIKSAHNTGHLCRHRDS